MQTAPTSPPSTASQLPARRSSLIVRALGEQGPYVIKDTDNGAYFQLGEEEHFLLTQLDGEKSAEAVCSAYTQRFEQSLSREELDEFLEMAQRRGLLMNAIGLGMPLEQANNTAKLPGHQSILFWRIKLCDPDRFFTWLAPKLSFLWTRMFLLCSSGCILLAALTLLLNYQEAVFGFQRVLSWEAAVCAWLALGIVIALHESAHGLTCKRYGGEVREIGFLLVYFQPAFYCNVSDAWFFPERSKRLWVTFAGAYCELFIWSLATLIWRLTEPGSTINYLALVVMITTGLTSLFNLNPLIKLDGYYLLCDYLEIPSLRPRAFRYLAARLKWWRPLDPLISAVPARERRFFWAYGLLAWIYSVGLLGVVVVSCASFLTQRYQGWGFVLLSALLVYAFRTPLRRALYSVVPPVHGDAAMKHLTKRMLALLKLVAVLAAVCAALYFVRAELRISGEFKVLPIHNAEVRAEVEGILEEIPRDEGEVVKAGELVARLSDRDYGAEVRKIKAEIEEKGAKLKMLKAGPRAEAVELARTTVAKGEERLKYANTYLSMEKNLFADKLSSRKDFEVAEEIASVREKELEEALGNLKVILAGSRPEEIEAIQAEINRLSAQQNYLEDELRLLRVVSPITGVITTHKLKERVGGNVRKGDLIAVVHDVNTVTAEISVPEREISEVKLGQRVLLRARAFPQTGFEGKITLIAPIATRPSESLGERTVLVVTQLDNAERLLKPEMSGNAKIYGGKRRLLDLMTRRLARFIRVEFWSWW